MNDYIYTLPQVMLKRLAMSSAGDRLSPDEIYHYSQVYSRLMSLESFFERFLRKKLESLYRKEKYTEYIQIDFPDGCYLDYDEEKRSAVFQVEDFLTGLDKEDLLYVAGYYLDEYDRKFTHPCFRLIITFPSLITLTYDNGSLTLTTTNGGLCIQHSQLPGFALPYIPVSSIKFQFCAEGSVLDEVKDINLLVSNLQDILDYTNNHHK